MGKVVATYERPTDIPASAAIVALASSMVVECQDTYDFALAEAKKHKEIGSRWNAERLRKIALVQPILDDIERDFGPIIKACKLFETQVKATATKWVTDERARARAAQEALDKAHREAQAAAAKKAAALAAAGKADEAAAVVAVASVAAAPQAAVFDGRSGASGTTTRKKGYVVDAAAFLAYAATNPVLLSCIEFKQANLNRLPATGIPGFELRDEETITLR